MQIQWFDADVIDADITAAVIDEPEENLKQAALSWSGPSDDAYLLARSRFERNRSQWVGKMFPKGEFIHQKM